MSAINFKNLRAHIGHNIVCTGYALTDDDGDRIGEYQNVAIECEDCNEILLDYDNV